MLAHTAPAAASTAWPAVPDRVVVAAVPGHSDEPESFAAASNIHVTRAVCNFSPGRWDWSGMPQHACRCPSGCGVGEDPGGGSMTSVQQKCESSGTALQGMYRLSYTCTRRESCEQHIMALPSLLSVEAHVAVSPMLFSPKSTMSMSPYWTDSTSLAAPVRAEQGPERDLHPEAQHGVAADRQQRWVTLRHGALLVIHCSRRRAPLLLEVHASRSTRVPAVQALRHTVFQATRGQRY